MKKLKKSLKNNLLKVNLNNSYFILKKTSQKGLNLTKTQNLTRSSIKKIGLNNVVDSTVLKFPIVLETFNNLKDFQHSLNNSKPVIAKVNNLVFKNNSSNILARYNSQLQLIKLKNSIFNIVPLILLIKGYLRSKNK